MKFLFETRKDKATRQTIIVLFFMATAVCLFLLSPGCRGEREYQSNLERVTALYGDIKADLPDIPDLSVDELIERREKATIILVDNRKPYERKVSMIPGAIPAEAFERDIERYRNDTVVVYCTIGGRSGEYTNKLRNQGIDAYNLGGGTLAWAHAGRSFVDGEGNETKRMHVYGSKWNLTPEGYEAVW